MLKIKFDKIGIPSKEIYLTETKPLKVLEDDDILIEIIYFPINPADLLLVEGNYAATPLLPSAIGAECVAKVKEVGSSIKNFKVDDVVLPLCRDNWVEQKIVNQNELIKLPPNIDLIQASMLKVNPATAYLMLNNYVKINKGDFIIQNAANSGVGNYIIQLCKMYDVKTINLVRREKLFSSIKELGADYVFNMNLKSDEIKSIEQLKPKLFIDAVAGSNVNKIAKILTNGSTIINYGLLEGKNIELDPHNTIFKDIILKGFWLSLWLGRMSQEEKNILYLHLSELILMKKIHTKVKKVYHIKNITAAIEAASKYNRDGKILVTTQN